MSDSDLIGEIRLFPYTFVPRGWLPCNGQLLDTSRNTALFSIIGYTWGGNGTTQFALPDLNSRAAMGSGPDPDTKLGNKLGDAQVYLDSTTLPPHSHTLQRKAAANVATKVSSPGPQTNYGQLHVITGAAPVPVTSHLIPNGTPNTTFSPNALSAAGGGMPHENRQPYLVMIYAICVDGMFPQFD